MRKPVYLTVGALLIILVDQALKYSVRTNPFFQDGVFVLHDWFGIRYFHNTNLALSIPFPNTIALVSMIVILCGLGILLVRSHYWRTQWGMYLVIAGAVSNIYDRMLFDGVIDYIVIPFGGIINLADVAVVCGACGLLLYSQKAFTRER